MTARDKMRRPGVRPPAGLLPWYLSPKNAEEIFRPAHEDIDRPPPPPSESPPRMLADAGGDSSPAMMEIARMLAAEQPQAPARIDLSSMPGPRAGGEVNRMDLSRPRADYEPQVVNRDAKRDREDIVADTPIGLGIAREALGQALLMGQGDDLEAYLTGRQADDVKRERHKFADDNRFTANASYAGGLVGGGLAARALKALGGGAKALDDLDEGLPPRFEPDLRQAMRNVEGIESSAKPADDLVDSLQRLLSNPQTRADIQGKPMELSPADILMMTAGAAPGAGPVGTKENPLPETEISEHDLSGLSPVDRLRGQFELNTGAYLTEAEKRKNAGETIEAGLGMLPVIGNAMSAEDAYDSGSLAADAFGEGNTRAGLMHSALAALSGVGAITGLPVGKAAGRAVAGASSRAGIFGGIGAKTADHDALARAREMQGAGADRADIWRETGWFQGPEGKWRFEIDDSGASMTPRAKQVLDPKGPTARAFGTMGEFMDHPELAKAYPDIPGSVTTLERGGGSGAFRDWDDMINLEPRNVPEARRVGLHELQHRVQRDEGFAPGANASYGRDAYQRSAGEVEARNVEARSAMDAEGRRAIPPWETQSIPDEQQLLNDIAPGAPQSVWLPETDQGKIADVLSRRAGDQPLRDIYSETGNFLEPGGRVMGELSDKGMQVWPGSVKPGDEVPLGMLAEHPELFDRFPQYRDIPTKITNKIDTHGGAPKFMTEPGTGAFEVSVAPGKPGVTQRGIAKLLQYKIGEDQGMPAALRHIFDAPQTLGDAAGAFRNVKPAGREDLDALAAYVDRMGKLRNDMLRDMEMADPHRVRKIQEMTGKNAAGNVTAAHAAGRSTMDDEAREAMYPYSRNVPYMNRSRRPPHFEDMLVLPPENASPDELMDFLRRWRKYGAGMPTGG